MEELKNIFNEYEGNGICYRGRCDDIKEVVIKLLSNMPDHNDKNNNEVIDTYLHDPYSRYKFIKEIKVNNDICCIKYIGYDGNINCVSFSLIPKQLNEEVGRKAPGEFSYTETKSFCFDGRCHSATSIYLKLHKTENIRAVTSICINNKNIKYFHSYIWDVDNDLIIDFAKNIIMKKSDYDFLFVDYDYDREMLCEINVLDYNEFLSSLKATDYYNCGESYCRLLYLALVKLYNEKNNTDYHKPKQKTFSSFLDAFFRNFVTRDF